jgi:hypothetical protein
MGAASREIVGSVDRYQVLTPAREADSVMARLKRMSSAARARLPAWGVPPVSVGAADVVGLDRQVRFLGSGIGDLVGPAHQPQRCAGLLSAGYGVGDVGQGAVALRPHELRDIPEVTSAMRT